MNMKRNHVADDRIAKLLAFVVMSAVFFITWESIVRFSSISFLIVPPPSAVLRVFMTRGDYLFNNAAQTVIEAAFGFLIGASAGIILATLFIFSKIVEDALYPYAIALKAVPLVAIAPIVVTWFGTGILSKIVLAAIISFFPVLVNTVEGLKSTEPEPIALFESWSASSWQVFTKLRLPYALPSIFSGLKIASSLAGIGAVVAEFIGAQAGIGHVIKSSTYFLSTDVTFAAIIVSALIGIAFFAVVSIIERKVVFWR